MPWHRRDSENNNPAAPEHTGFARRRSLLSRYLPRLPFLILRCVCTRHSTQPAGLRAHRVSAGAMVTSIKENNSLSSFVSVYPNPFSDNITVKNNTNELVEVSIVDLLGKTILINNSNSNTIVLNTNEIPQGIYFINVKTAKEKASYKIVK